MDRVKPRAVAVFRSPDKAINVAGMLGDHDVTVLSDGLRALEKCRTESVDLVVAEAVLPSLDGFGLAEALRGLNAVTRPGAVVIAPRGALRRRLLPGCELLAEPVDADALRAAAERARLENRHMSDEFSRRAAELLDALGVPDHAGRKYLADAVFLCSEDRRVAGSLTKRLYPAVAARHGVSPRAVESAMRRAIETAWNRGSIEAQYRIFRDTIDAARGKPTCGGMIAQLSEILRMEG